MIGLFELLESSRPVHLGFDLEMQHAEMTAVISHKDSPQTSCWSNHEYHTTLLLCYCLLHKWPTEQRQICFQAIMEIVNHFLI